MHDVEQPPCLNCGRALTGPYCAACGQKQTRVNPTLSEFVRDTTCELTDWDGKIPSTLKALFLAPGSLTIDFIAGRRARWLSPLRVYLICSVAYFVSEPLVEAVTGQAGREIAQVRITNADGSRTLSPEMRREIEAGLPARVFGVDRLERAAQNSAALNREVKTVLPKAMFLLLPVFALLTRAVWKRRMPRYPMHLYVALHLHAAWFGVLTLLTLLSGFTASPIARGIAGAAALGYAIWYGLLTARRVFQDSWPLTLVKSGMVAGGYAVCSIVVSLLLLGYVLATM